MSIVQTEIKSLMNSKNVLSLQTSPAENFPRGEIHAVTLKSFDKLKTYPLTYPFDDRSFYSARTSVDLSNNYNWESRSSTRRLICRLL